MLSRQTKRTILKILSMFSVVRGYNIPIIALAQYLSAIFILAPEKRALFILLDFDLFIIVALLSLGIFAAFLVQTLPILIFSESHLLKNSPKYICDFCSSNLKKIADKNNVIVILVSTFVLFVIYKLAGFDRRIFFIVLFAWAVLILIVLHIAFSILYEYQLIKYCLLDHIYLRCCRTS